MHTHIPHNQLSMLGTHRLKGTLNPPDAPMLLLPIHNVPYMACHAMNSYTIANIIKK